jgi:hypothetical protein
MAPSSSRRPGNSTHSPADTALARKTRQGKRSQDRKEEERRRARRSRLTKFFIAGSVLVALGIACVVGCLALLASSPQQVSGQLSGLGSISLAEGTQADGGISPLCGCEKPKFNEWRGITFASRETTIARTGRAPWTEWVVSAAEPESIELNGHFEDVVVEALKLRGQGRFNPEELMAGPQELQGRVLSREVLRQYRLALMTHRAGHVAQLGPVPVGAWIPFPGSRVTLTDTPTIFPGQERPRARLVERYPSDVGWIAPDQTAEPQAYPLGDFLGPVVIWFRDPSATIPGTDIRPTPRKDTITALVIRHSVFSTRIGVVPLNNREASAKQRFGRRHPYQATGNVEFGQYDGGHTTVTVQRPLGEQEYAALRRRVHNQPRVDTEFSSTFTRKPPSQHGRYQVMRVGETKRYPPLPKENGFNVFGPLESVLFRGVHGALEVSDRAIKLVGSADVELNDVSSLRNGVDEERVPALLKAGSGSARLTFHGVGTVRVNGAEETTAAQSHRELWKTIGVIAGIVSLLIGMVSLIYAIIRDGSAVKK